jgi:DNA (cytosine-5)-methyltransferase 1
MPATRRRECRPLNHGLKLNELALFAGAGGGILGGVLLGWRTVCAVECDAYAAAVLAQRQNDGVLEPFPIWSDVRSFDGSTWRGRVDVVSGGFPCQDISLAGRGAGIEGEQSGLWLEMARIIREVRPRFAFVENSPGLTARGLGRVLGDLAEMGFDAEWGVLGAAHAGAPHLRERIWIVAHRPIDGRREGRARGPDTGDQGEPEQPLLQPQVDQGRALHDAMRGRHRAPEGPIQAGQDGAERAGWWSVEPGLGRVADGVADRVDRIRALGNGQVPAVAELAWRLLMTDVHRQGGGQ